VVKGQETLNLAFVANLFRNHPGLDPPKEEVDIVEETREEKVITVTCMLTSGRYTVIYEETIRHKRGTHK
jgi:hypothetical protein